MTPHYEAIHARILEGKGVNGDETWWRVAGLLYRVWCMVGDDAVWFNIQKGRGMEEATQVSVCRRCTDYLAFCYLPMLPRLTPT